MQGLVSSNGLLSRFRSLIAKALNSPQDATKFLDGTLNFSLRQTFTNYTVSSASSTGVTDNASPYDLPGLSIANVPAGIYLALLGYMTGTKSGQIRTTITDGSNNILWPAAGNYESTTNSDSGHQLAATGIITLGSTLTVKARGAAAAAVGNYTIQSRHLTLIKVG